MCSIVEKYLTFHNYDDHILIQLVRERVNLQKKT